MDLSYCLVADILGFRSLVLNADEDYQAEVIDGWIELVKTATESASLERYQLISDSVFVAAPASPDGLGSLVEVSRTLLEMGLHHRLPVRGAIARGELRWSPDVAHGPAIVWAYELGADTNWIGVACSYAFPDLDELWGWRNVAMYPAPVKSRTPVARPCVSWRIPADGELKSLTLPSANDPPARLDAVIAKVRNTIDFRTYLQRQARYRRDDEASRFHN